MLALNNLRIVIGNKTQTNKKQTNQILLCITNYSIKHQSFVFTVSNDKILLFQAIQFSITQQN